jgi:hypothetical protein
MGAYYSTNPLIPDYSEFEEVSNEYKQTRKQLLEDIRTFNAELLFSNKPAKKDKKRQKKRKH